MIPITQDTVLPNGSYWVCSGVTVEFSDFTFAWVESDCNVTISGGLGNYSFKPNCDVTLTSNAFNNIVVYDNSTTVVDNGSNTYPTVCTEVTYGYASAPVGGCDIAAGIDQTISADRPAYYPNPANGTLNISGAANKTVVIRDMTGRTVLHRSAAEGPVDISTVPPGTYFVTMPDGGKEVTGRVVVF
ncbi:MAG: T9SS type A sorting domain-containing protein [Flavobacteriales bacterium]|nr:T9SS type A sorting domain-containing protein [Flavobacteriales bacterium]